jgi:hypothetical protein
MIVKRSFATTRLNIMCCARVITSFARSRSSALPLTDLKYWSVARQEAYKDAAASLEAERRSLKAS